MQTALLPFQERIVAEKAELDERIAFGKTDVFEKLTMVDQQLLWLQSRCMSWYSFVLGQRIALFKNDV